MCQGRGSGWHNPGAGRKPQPIEQLPSFIYDTYDTNHCERLYVTIPAWWRQNRSLSAAPESPAPAALAQVASSKRTRKLWSLEEWNARQAQICAAVERHRVRGHSKQASKLPTLSLPTNQPVCVKGGCQRPVSAARVGHLSAAFKFQLSMAAMMVISGARAPGATAPVCPATYGVGAIDWGIPLPLQLGGGASRSPPWLGLCSRRRCCCCRQSTFEHPNSAPQAADQQHFEQLAPHALAAPVQLAPASCPPLIRRPSVLRRCPRSVADRLPPITRPSRVLNSLECHLDRASPAPSRSPTPTTRSSAR